MHVLLKQMYRARLTFFNDCSEVSAWVNTTARAGATPLAPRQALNLSARAQQLQPRLRPVAHHLAPTHIARSYTRTGPRVSSNISSSSVAPRNPRRHVRRSHKGQEAGEQERLSPGEEEATAFCKQTARIALRIAIHCTDSRTGDTVRGR